MTMYESRVPERIERPQIIKAMEALGIEPQSAHRVCIDSKTVTIEASLRDEHGMRRLAPLSEDGESTGYLKAIEKISITEPNPRADRTHHSKGGAL